MYSQKLMDSKSEYLIILNASLLTEDPQLFTWSPNNETFIQNQKINLINVTSMNHHWHVDFNPPISVQNVYLSQVEISVL